MRCRIGGSEQVPRLIQHLCRCTRAHLHSTTCIKGLKQEQRETPAHYHSALTRTRLASWAELSRRRRMDSTGFPAKITEEPWVREEDVEWPDCRRGGRRYDTGEGKSTHRAGRGAKERRPTGSGTAVSVANKLERRAVNCTGDEVPGRCGDAVGLWDWNLLHSGRGVCKQVTHNSHTAGHTRAHTHRK